MLWTFFSHSSPTSHSSQCSLILAILPLRFYTLIDHRRCVGIDSLKYDCAGTSKQTTVRGEKSFYSKFHCSSSSALSETRQNSWDEIPAIFKQEIFSSDTIFRNLTFQRGQLFPSRGHYPELSSTVLVFATRCQPIRFALKNVSTLNQYH